MVIPSDKNENPAQDKPAHHKKDRASEVANTFEWLITAFILAFVFRAFVMEAFRIPTGSMADTLRGAHFRLCCPQCGYKYEYGFVPSIYHLPEDTIPAKPVETAVTSTRCPSCGFYQSGKVPMPVANGDRILVLKCIYQFFQPKRWDVVVFKNPTDPTVNYIKRLIGLAGEKVEIIDGDIYIDGQIARKPPKVQEELWMPVYNNDYQPVRPYSFNGRTWKQPFVTDDFSQWKTDSARPTLFTLDGSAGGISTLVYDSSIGNDFRAAYAYDEVSMYREMPYCSDLMVRFYCSTTRNEGGIGITLGKYKNDYNAWVDFAGEMIITKSNNNGKPEELIRKSITTLGDNPSAMTLVKFANVDHKLIFEYGKEKLTYDLGTGRQDAGQITGNIQPRVKILGSGKLTLSHVAVFRDIHYTQAGYLENGVSGRATENNPLMLGKDDFFVLGDNSPNSEDGRWWRDPGVPNRGVKPYRAGIVPRDYLVGKALFVYWPSGLRPYPEFPFGIIPDIGDIRFIYGGSSK
jgi:signal peptidase I